MIKLLYAGIDVLNIPHWPLYIQYLPHFMQQEIGKYKRVEDRKRCLLGRLLLLYAMRKAGYPAALLSKWSRNENNKPHIRDWHHFNIAHSGQYVLLAWHSEEIGVDIELHADIDITVMSACFHADEQTQVLQSHDSLSTFYTIWAKKEAVLKAAGTGLVNGLKQICCTGKSVWYQDRQWYLYPVNVDNEYAAYICSSAVNQPVLINKFCLNDLAQVIPIYPQVIN